MKKHWKNYYLIWNLLFISLLFSGCSESEQRDSEVKQNLVIPDEQSDGVKTITMDGDKITMEMYARHIDRYYKKKETYIDSLFVKKFNEEGGLNSTLSCQNAIIDETGNIIECRGDVMITSENGILRTPKLTWNRETDGILAEEGVVMERGDDILRGEMMKTDMNMDKVEIINVSAEGNVRSGNVEW